MDNSKEGVVYFSLGSVVKSSKMPKETVSLLLSELSKIEQTVLWKWEAEDVPQLPKNVIIRKWFPQNDILGTYLILILLISRSCKSLISKTYWFLIWRKISGNTSTEIQRGVSSHKKRNYCDILLYYCL